MNRRRRADAMPVDLARTCLAAVGGWALAGLLFGLLFIASGGPGRIDPAARTMPWSARLLLLPGLLALWPLVLWKWLRRRQPPVA